MRRRLTRQFVGSVILSGAVFALAGTWRDPWLWAYVLVWSGIGVYAMFSLDADLARERFHPPTSGADSTALVFIRLVALLHITVGALDAGRWHLTAPVPLLLRALALLALPVAFGMFFRAMRENRFFSSVVRVQRDRGHRVVDTGPYARVRHPGYAGMILGLPLSGFALGSWTASAIGAVLSLLMLRRAMFEDGFLKANLEGYAAYATRVRYRLIPRVW